jgi:DNA-binding NtrC family response regulator
LGRIVAATNRQVPRQVNEGTFRADLFYRLAAAEVQLPPLRERREDIPLLVDALVAELPEGRGRALDQGLLARLQQGQWPGNVRELRNAVHRLVLLGEEAEEPTRASAAPLPLLTPPELLRLPYREARARLLESFRAAYARQALAQAGTVSETARRVGVDRGTIHRWLARAPEDEGPLP